MKVRKLGKLEVSAIGMGCMNLSFGMGAAVSRREGVDAIRHARERGIAFFDTAEAYGPFVNEELVGEAVEPFREDAVAATKFGMISEEGGLNSRQEHIRKTAEQSPGACARIMLTSSISAALTRTFR